MADAQKEPHPTTTPRHLPYQVDPEANRDAYYENHWKQVALDLLLKHCRSPDMTVLDYGCGRGETLKLFGEKGFKVTGTDVDPECLQLSSEFGKTVPLMPENIVGQFGRKSFDIVSCFHVLEHVENPRQTLSALGEVAREYLVLAVPNLRRLHGLFVRSVDPRLVNEGHMQSWDHWHFQNLAERYCGLDLIEWGFDATILPGVSSLAEKLFGLKAAVWLDTGPFKRIFPLHGISVLGLFRPR